MKRRSFMQSLGAALISLNLGLGFDTELVVEEWDTAYDFMIKKGRQCGKTESTQRWVIAIVRWCRFCKESRAFIPDEEVRDYTCEDCQRPLNEVDSVW